jgi:hypothetical protein
MLHTFPRAAKWINWWFKEDIAPMIFPAASKMPQELFGLLPDTDNAQEAMHRVYYQFGDTQNTVEYGMKLVVLFAEDLAAKEVAVQHGHTTCYGSTERWKVRLHF